MPIITSDPEFDVDESDESDFKPLSAQEAQALREAQPMVSPWRIVGWQILVGLLVALATWGATKSMVAGWSAAYGALAVVIPAALFVRGLSRQQGAPNAGSALTGFFVWEMVKIALTVAMLFAAPKLVSMLSWPAMLVGLILTMKVYWIALGFKRKPKAGANRNA